MIHSQISTIDSIDGEMGRNHRTLSKTAYCRVYYSRVDITGQSKKSEGSSIHFQKETLITPPNLSSTSSLHNPVNQVLYLLKNPPQKRKGIDSPNGAVSHCEHQSSPSTHRGISGCSTMLPFLQLRQAALVKPEVKRPDITDVSDASLDASRRLNGSD